MPKISEAQKEARRRLILDSAAEVFSQKGYSGASVDDVVKHAGISKGGIYTYFASKEEIFLEIAEERFRFRNERVRSLNPELSAAAQIEIYIRWLLDSLEEEAVAQKARFSFEFWTVIARNKEKHHLARTRYDKFAADLGALVRRGIERGEFREDLSVDSAVLLLLSGMDGIGFMATVMGIPVSQEVVADFIAQYLTYWRV